MYSVVIGGSRISRGEALTQLLVSFYFLQRAIHLIYKERRWYHFLYMPSAWRLDPYISNFVFELTDNINLYTYHGWMRRVVKFYRVIDVAAVLTSLFAMITSRYWYIFLVAYFVLRLLYVAFYWPHAWCRCACYRTLKWLYSLLAVATFWFYVGCPLWPLFPSMGIEASSSLIGVFLFFIAYCFLMVFVWYMKEWTKGNLPPFKHGRHPVYSARVTRREILAVPLIQRPEGC